MKKLFFCLFLSSTFFTQADTSFFEKVASIAKDLYKIPAHDLCTILQIAHPSIPFITADHLKNEMTTHPDILVINVLPEYYHQDCHITGSINAPLKELVERAQSWDRNQKIVAYCALDECDAGQKGAILLSCMGFTDVQDYKGGIKEWFQLGYPTQGPALSEYLHVKSVAIDQEFARFPEMLVCSRQTRWMSAE